MAFYGLLKAFDQLNLIVTAIDSIQDPFIPDRIKESSFLRNFKVSQALHSNLFVLRQAQPYKKDFHFNPG